MLNRVRSDGSTKRELAENLVRQRGTWPADVPQEPPFPEGLRYLWRWYQSLSLGRGSSGFGGPNPLSFLEVAAWAQLTGVQIDRWELEIIKSIDVMYLASFADESKIIAKKDTAKAH